MLSILKAVSGKKKKKKEKQANYYKELEGAVEDGNLLSETIWSSGFDIEKCVASLRPHTIEFFLVIIILFKKIIMFSFK